MHLSIGVGLVRMVRYIDRPYANREHTSRFYGSQGVERAHQHQSFRQQPFGQLGGMIGAPATTTVAAPTLTSPPSPRVVPLLHNKNHDHLAAPMHQVVNTSPRLDHTFHAGTLGTSTNLSYKPQAKMETYNVSSRYGNAPVNVDGWWERYGTSSRRTPFAPQQTPLSTLFPGAATRSSQQEKEVRAASTMEPRACTRERASALGAIEHVQLCAPPLPLLYSWSS